LPEESPVEECPYHKAHEDKLNDHEQRIRSDNDRLIRREMEAEGMAEKMELMIVAQKEIQKSMDSFKTWQTSAMAVFGVFLFLVQMAPTISGWLK
jgi:hypothetical protein